MDASFRSTHFVYNLFNIEMHILEYFKKPYCLENYQKISFGVFVKLIGYFLLVLIVATIFIVILNYLKIIPDKNTSLLLDKRYSIYFLSLYLVLLGPFIEECIFRLILKPTQINTILFLICLICYILFRYLIKSKLFLPFIFLLGLFFIFLLINKLKFDFTKLVSRKYPVFFYFIAICFGILHITNYGIITLPLVLLAPIITSPQIFIGLACGYLRMNYGFIYGFFFHVIINFSGFLLSFHEIYLRL